MTADTAVTLMLEHDIMTNPLIPVDACPAIATALERMWQVGFDHASKKIMTRHTTPVKLVSLDGKTLATYGSIEEAASTKPMRIGGIGVVEIGVKDGEHAGLSSRHSRQPCAI